MSGSRDRLTVLGLGIGQDELGQMLRLRQFREKHPASADDRADFTPGDMIERDQVAACR